MDHGPSGNGINAVRDVAEGVGARDRHPGIGVDVEPLPLNVEDADHASLGRDREDERVRRIEDAECRRRRAGTRHRGEPGHIRDERAGKIGAGDGEDGGGFRNRAKVVDHLDGEGVEDGLARDQGIGDRESVEEQIADHPGRHVDRRDPVITAAGVGQATVIRIPAERLEPRDIDRHGSVGVGQREGDRRSVHAGSEKASFHKAVRWGTCGDGRAVIATVDGELGNCLGREAVGGEDLDREELAEGLAFGERVCGSEGVVEEVGDDCRGDVERGGAVGAGLGIREASVGGDPAVETEPGCVDGDGAVDACERKGSGGSVHAEGDDVEGGGRLRCEAVGGEDLNREELGDGLAYGEGVGGGEGVVEEVGDDCRGDVEGRGAVGAGGRVSEAQISGDPAVEFEPSGIDGEGTVDAGERECCGCVGDADGDGAGFDEAV